MNDAINPDYYNKGGVSCADAQEAAVIGKDPDEAVWVAQIIKYLWRYESKGGLQDIEKALWYLNRLKQCLEKKASMYRIVGTPKGVGLQTPWNTLMVPREGDMFNNDDKAREKLLETILKRGGSCPCRPDQGQDTLCPCIYYREKGECICGLFVKIPQVVKEAVEDAKVEDNRDDSETTDGAEE